MLVTRTSIFSGKITTMDLPVTQEQLDRWQLRRELIQNVFPELSAAEREFLMSGVTTAEWDAMFPPDDDEELERDEP
jgi:hypothetical protein